MITFTKRAKKKNWNENNDDQIRNYNIINLNWIMKLKTTKTFTKESRKKIRNSKTEDDIEKYNIW
jgi:hypothetical protein